ncbi:uncharacterized protein BX663DRAFT_247324 [Cokeromyces recurvatus]|uniref:uncharacterized protein n=1 Tax=Cokeromyces recurvatus TaxID=90255 RepID=UPI00221FAE6B|nr:uncharacterized protein BX663DRAFT_247324 [Cokeromyces recurvatus]KAI7905971.1 hypothetical protein BX663DRAFT_247324 [Cokeromyces recurvatus]
MLSTKLTKELFHDGRSEVVRKIETKPIALNLEEARENEMKRQFIYTIASSRDDIIKSYNDTTDNIAYLKNKKLPFFKDYTQQRNNSLNIESIKSKCKMDPTSSTNDAKAPNLYQSASKMLRLLTSQEKPSVASYWEKLKEFCIEKDASIVLKNKKSNSCTNFPKIDNFSKSNRNCLSVKITR